MTKPYDAVITLRALEVALQRSADLAWLHTDEFADYMKWGLARVRTPGGIVLVHRDDDQNVARIIVHGIGQTSSVNKLPPVNRRQAMHRVYRAALAAQSPPMHLPHAWAEYHSGRFLSFFACSPAEGSYRWIAELAPAASQDIIFWEIDDAPTPSPLQLFVPNVMKYQHTVEYWVPALDRARSEVFRETERPNRFVSLEGVIELRAATDKAVAGHFTYSDWVPKLTVEQRIFLDHTAQLPMKLRGPAGSGKTLALELKALRELYAANVAGVPSRIVFVTHSWAMAEQIDRTLRVLDDQGGVDGITVMPLTEIARGILPKERYARNLEVLGEDSLSGRRLLLDRIAESVDQVVRADWIAYRLAVSDGFRARVESAQQTPTWNSLVWDLMQEFSSVLSASGILPGVLAEKRYLGLRRLDWMMGLATDAEKRFVLRIYTHYVNAMRADGKISVDQLNSDFLAYLETFAWDYRRVSEGYDLICVDEFHLFSDQERQILAYLARDPAKFPAIMMALDPRQSQAEIYPDFPIASVDSAQNNEPEATLGVVKAVDLTSVHRFSPQILEFVKFIHRSFPTLQLGADWTLDADALESKAANSESPRLYRYVSREDEIQGATQSALARHQKMVGGTARVAVIVLDEAQLSVYETTLRASGVPVVVIQSREDIDELRYSRRSVVVTAAQYASGLQFDDVVVTALPVSLFPKRLSDPQLRYVLSALYLAVSRASRHLELHVIASSGDGDLASFFGRAESAGVVEPYGEQPYGLVTSSTSP